MLVIYPPTQTVIPMRLLSIGALCLVASRPALSQVGSTPTLKANFHVRDDPSQTVTLTEPSPTSTDPGVLAAYTTYSQKCGPDLDTATQAALKAFEKITTRTGPISITDQEFISWASNNYPNYMQATQDCKGARISYWDTLIAATSSSSAAAESSASTTRSSAASSPGKSTASSQKDSAVSLRVGGPSWVIALVGVAVAMYTM
ncbi:hypothetical protein C8R43DRAFT_1139951 [Mycena crocata]|nr:hypothetical protein C8R43DRAFT_1139951 [Mycena crocata]